MAVVAADPELVTAAFRDFDQKGDGKISRDDLGCLLQKLDPSMMSEDRVDLLIAEFNAKNAKNRVRVDYSEFIMWLLAGYCADDDSDGGVGEQELPQLTCGAPPGVWAGWNCWQKGVEPSPQVLWLDVGTLQVLGAGSTECNGIYKGSASKGFEHASGRARVALDPKLQRFHIIVRQANCRREICYFSNILLPAPAETEISNGGPEPLPTTPDEIDPGEWGGWAAEGAGALPLPRVAWLGQGTLQVIGAGSGDCNGGYKLAPDGNFEHTSGKAKVAQNPADGRYEITVFRGGSRTPAYSTSAAPSEE